MVGRALVGVLLIALGCAGEWAPRPAAAQDPESAGVSGPACAHECGGVRIQPQPRVIPSAPTELADGHADPSTIILAVFALASFAGLVVSVLNRASMDDL